MIRRPIPFLLAATFALTGLVTVSPLAASQTTRTEAEFRSNDAGWCSPDGERMEVWDWPGTSNGQVLSYPESGCWSEFNLNLGGPAGLILGAASGGGSGECTAWDAHLDGGFLGSTDSQCSFQTIQALVVLLAGAPVSIPGGAHTLRITSRVTSGPGWANSALDYVDLDVATGSRFEGEGRTSDAGGCTPDGERMEVWDWAGASGGQVLSYPNHGCWAQFRVDLAGYSTLVIVATSGGGPTACTAWDVTVDGTAWGSTNPLCTRGALQGADLLQDGGVATIPPGWHEIRVTARYTGGPQWENSALDFIEFAPGALNCGRDSDRDGLGDCVEDASWARRNAVFCNAAQTSCSYPMPTFRDIFVEIDWMPGQRPSSNTLASVWGAFASRGFYIHWDVGDLGGGTQVPERRVTVWREDVLWYYYANHFDRTGPDSRDRIYHYMLAACSNTDPSSGGAAATPGDVLVVWMCATRSNVPGANNDARVAHVLMHELAHNLLGRHYVDLTECNAGLVAITHNPALSHFTEPGNTCTDGQPDVDYFAHSADPADAMCYCSSMTLVDMVSATWNAVRPAMFLVGAPPATYCGVPGVDVAIPAVKTPVASAAVVRCETHLDRVLPA